MATITELRNKVLEELGVASVGETPSSEEAATIEGMYDEVYAELKSERLVSWGPTESIPAKFVRPIVVIVAAEAMTGSGITVADGVGQTILSKLPNAWRRLRVLIAEEYTPKSEENHYF